MRVNYENEHNLLLLNKIKERMRIITTTENTGITQIINNPIKV